MTRLTRQQSQHIVPDGAGGHCRHCDARLILTMPMRFDTLLMRQQVFLALHVDCPCPEPPCAQHPAMAPHTPSGAHDA